MIMARKPISITLDESNLVWLKGLTERSGARSISETLNRLVTSARESPSAAKAARSVAGTIDISPGDPQLADADDAVRDLFARSLARPFLVKEERSSLAPSRKRRG